MCIRVNVAGRITSKLWNTFLGESQVIRDIMSNAFKKNKEMWNCSSFIQDLHSVQVLTRAACLS